MPDQPIDPGVLRAARRILDPRQPTATLAQERIACIIDEETNLRAMRAVLERVRQAYHNADAPDTDAILGEIDAALAMPQPAEKGK